MNQETAPVAEVENTATEPTETPEIVTPEAAAEQEPETPKSEKDWRDEALKRAERRINRKHSELAHEQAERRLLEERLAKYEKQQEPEEKLEVDPREFERKVQQTAAQLRATEKLNEQCNTLWTKGTKEFPDFEQAVKAVAEDLPLFDRKDGATPAMQVVLEADNPAALLHYLGKNPDVTAELADLTPTQLSRRLDRIEREIAAAPKTSSAPKPLTPVKPAAAGVTEPSDKDSLEVWLAKERARLNKKLGHTT